MSTKYKFRGQAARPAKRPRLAEIGKVCRKQSLAKERRALLFITGNLFHADV
jgi:hypothetical protein